MNRLLIFLALLFSCLNTYAQTIPQIRATCKARINGINYKAIGYNEDRILIKDGKGKTVLNIGPGDAAGFNDLQFVDFDGDGYKDLMIDYLTNVPSVNYLYLYNKISKGFVKVDEFDRYPAAKRISGTQVFYSYHRSGCADMNWDSDLFIIKNYKPIKLGNISGNECGNSGIKDGIYIYKFKADEKSLYKSMPILTIKAYKDYKWGFIANYWRKHYKEFVK